MTWDAIDWEARTLTVNKPNKISSYDTNLYKLCEAAGIAPSSMLTLRHTYVHMTEESLSKAVRQFEANHTSSMVST